MTVAVLLSKKEQRLPPWMDAAMRIAYLLRKLLDSILSTKKKEEETL